MKSLGVVGDFNRLGVGVEYEFKNWGDKKTAQLFVGNDFAPSEYGWIFPTNKETVRVGVGIIRPDTEAAPKQLLEEFLKSDMPKRLNLKIGDLQERHFGVIPSDGPSAVFVHGKCIAVGDAVGQALPLVGEGIRFCIDSGRHAGEAIAHALKDSRNEDAYLQVYVDWWNKKHRRSFTVAQKTNFRVSAYDDAKWDEKVGMLTLFNGDLMAAFLRGEFSYKSIFILLSRNPMLATYHLFKRVIRRIQAKMTR